MISFKRKNKVKCKRCNKKLKEWDVLGFEFVVGYGSKYDGDMIKCTLCYECMDYFIDNHLAKYCEISEWC